MKRTGNRFDDRMQYHNQLCRKNRIDKHQKRKSFFNCRRSSRVTTWQMDALLRCVLLIALCGLGEQVTKAESELQCRQKSVLVAIYANLHDAITENFISSPKTQHVDLLASGIPLDYNDFNPGKKSRFATPGTLPLTVVENALPLVDKIFPTGFTANPVHLHANLSEDYHFDSLSSTFDYILTQLMVLPRNFSSEDTLRAKYYLQELVPNPERAIRNETELPRYLLYDYYRSLYLKGKEEKDSEMDSHRQLLTQQDYKNWGVKKLPTLESNSDAAFQKWIIFGYKTEVEKELQYFDIDSHEDKLMSTRALFKSMAVYSQRDPHVRVYPFSFVPENWYEVLKSDLPESSDELRYQESLLKAQEALMNATKNDLASKTNEDVNNSIEKIKDIMRKLRERVQNAVDKLLQMEVECFAKVNLTTCGDIINSHTAFRLLLDDVAEHFEQAAYLESILNGRSESITVLEHKLNEVAAKIKLLNTRIKTAQETETEEVLDMSSSWRSDSTMSTTCTEAGKIQFAFNSEQVPTADHLCSENDGSQSTEEGEEKKPYCSDVRVPLNATQNLLWHVHSCAVDSDLEAFDDLIKNFTRTMNSIEAKVMASLYKVKIKRQWLDEDIFRDSQHFTLKRNRGIVSPGPLQPLNYFHQVAESGIYLMPQFTSSLIIANNISLFFPGLGSWRDEYENDIDNHTNGIINILMKYTYAPTLEGGYGPFTLTSKGGSRDKAHNFRLERKNGGVLITFPGAQVIGFVSTVISKFPEIQIDPPNPNQCSVHPATKKRRKRSTLIEEDIPSQARKIRELANTLFADNFERYPDNGDADRVELSKTTFTPSQAVDRLLKEADVTHGQINKFVEMVDTHKQLEGDESRSILPLTVPSMDKDSNVNASGTQAK